MLDFVFNLNPSPLSEPTTISAVREPVENPLISYTTPYSVIVLDVIRSSSYYTLAAEARPAISNIWINIRYDV